jgi:hypothetical protein
LPLVKAKDGQFGLEAAAVFTSALARAGRWRAIKGGDPQDESAEQAYAAGACLRGAERSVSLLYFFFAASAQAGWAAAWASRLAAKRSACCWKAR